MSRQRIHFAPWQKPFPKARLARASSFLIAIAGRISRKKLYGNKLDHDDVQFVERELAEIASHLRRKALAIRRKRAA